MTSNDPEFEVVPPRLLTFGTVLIITAYGLLLVIPILAAILVVSLLRLSWLSFFLPLLAMSITTFFLPLGFGNTYVVKLVQGLHPAGGTPPGGFIAQITFNPRIRCGIRALLEDADDIGWLSVTETRLIFHGDSVRLSIPLGHIQHLASESSGWRGLFLYGPQTVVTAAGLPSANSFKLGERSSCFLPGSRKNARLLRTTLAARVGLTG
jgi:hypothetical protein